MIRLYLLGRYLKEKHELMNSPSTRFLASVTKTELTSIFLFLHSNVANFVHEEGMVRNNNPSGRWEKQNLSLTIPDVIIDMTILRVIEKEEDNQTKSTGFFFQHQNSTLQ